MTRRTVVWVRLALVLVFIVGAGVALAADLANRGLFWQFAWNVTGEETPLAQARGLMELAGRAFRPQPNVDRYAPVQHVGAPPFGVNTFLEQEVEPEKRARQMQLLADAGFTWVRQEFPWEDIEIHARGDFEDRRNNPDGVDAWAKYDHIVDLADEHGVTLLVRLDNPPDWAHEDPSIGDKAPPTNYDDFVNFAVAVAERYRGRITYYQIWNEPNIYPEWGQQESDPAGYTDLLCRTYTALKAVDPDIVVVSAALSPTNAMGGPNLNDFIYLQRMYDAGAADCFDVMAAQAYGLNSGPTDRRLRPTTVSFTRHLYLRDIMVANGDSTTPIWLTEAGWNPVPDEATVPEIRGRYDFGQVTDEQAARYLPMLYARAEAEWPWVGPIFVWHFKRPADYERDQAWYYFRLLEPDFTPRRTFTAMQQYIATHTPALGPGTYQHTDWRISGTGTRERDDRRAQGGTYLNVELLRLPLMGTHMMVRYRSGETVNVRTVGTATGSGPFYQYQYQSLSPSYYQTVDQNRLAWAEQPVGIAPVTRYIEYELAPYTQGDVWAFDSVTVYDDSWWRVGVPVATATVSGASLVFVALRMIVGWFRLRRERRAAHARR